MNIQENIRIAIFSIRTNMMRSLLTMLGIIIGVASVIFIITVGNGGRDYIVGKIRQLGSSTVSISVNTNTASAGEYINNEDIKAIKALDSVEYISPVVITFGNALTPKGSSMIIATSGTTDLGHVMNAQVKYGRFFNEEEFVSGRPVALIPSSSAIIMFGYENCVGKDIEFTINKKTVKLKIIGITTDSPLIDSGTSASASSMIPSDLLGSSGTMAGMIILPSTVTDAMMGSQGYYEMCYLTASNEKDLDSAGNSAVNVLYSRHGNYGSKAYNVLNMATYIDLLDTVINVFTTFIAAVSGISLVVGGIGVMNIMLVSVTERTREIGIRKALGAKTSTIMFQFLTESVILCLIGGILGFAIGVGGATAVSAIMNIPMTIKFSTIAIAVGFSSAIGIFFGIYPARRAAKMPPIEALRRE